MWPTVRIAFFLVAALATWFILPSRAATMQLSWFSPIFVLVTTILSCAVGFAIWMLIFRSEPPWTIPRFQSPLPYNPLGLAHVTGIYLLGTSAGALAASTHLGLNALLYAMTVLAGSFGAFGSVVVFARLFPAKVG